MVVNVGFGNGLKYLGGSGVKPAHTRYQIPSLGGMRRFRIGGEIGGGGGISSSSGYFTKDHIELRDYVGKFVSGTPPTRKGNITLEVAREIDLKDEFPRELTKKLAEANLIGASFPIEYGGVNLDTLSWIIILEELSKASGSVGIIMNILGCVATKPLLFGTEEQKENFLIPALKGEKIGAFALTEPDAGSDAFGGMKTYAVKNGENYILKGSKIFITLGAEADYVIVLARTDKIVENTISAFIVEKGMEGFTATKMEPMMGMKGTITSSLSFDGVILPEANLIGKIGEGKKISLEVLNEGRITVAGIGLGIIRAALELATEYANTRKQFGVPICQFEEVSRRLKKMKDGYNKSLELTIKAAQLKDKGGDIRKAAAEAKIFSSQAAVDAALEAQLILGAYGYSTDFPIERMIRDVLVLRIVEGATPLLESILAREKSK